MDTFAPGIAVIVPLYNKRAFVKRALESSRHQTFPPTQIVVVDDGSSDDGAAIVRQINDPRVRLISQPNRGVSAARNAGVAAADADWIAFLDADDEWMPGHLESLLNLRRAYPFCQVLAAAYVIRSNDGADRDILLRTKRAAVERRVLDDYFELASRSDPPLWTSAIAVSKNAIQSVGGFPQGIGSGEDLLTWARLATRYSIAFSFPPSAIYRQGAFATGIPSSAPETPDRVGTALHQLLQEAPLAQRPALRRYVGLWHKMRGTTFYRYGQRRDARAELIRSIAMRGPDWRTFCYLALASVPLNTRGFTQAIQATNPWRRSLAPRQSS
jgi:hypothetical protein